LTRSQVSIETIRQADPPVGSEVAARQTLDHQSRSGVCQKKSTNTTRRRCTRLKTATVAYASFHVGCRLKVLGSTTLGPKWVSGSRAIVEPVRLLTAKARQAAPLRVLSV
jgi:hypothetical protein